MAKKESFVRKAKLRINERAVSGWLMRRPIGSAARLLYNWRMDAAMVHDRLRRHMGEFYALGVERLAVFGSVGQGQNTKASDLDILVRFHTGKKTFDNYMDVKFLLEELFPGVNIDLVLESSLKPAIRDRVLAEARDVA